MVAAFEHGEDFASGMAGGDSRDEVGEIGKVFVGEEEVAEWVSHAAVESGGDEDELGAEFFHGGDELFLEAGEDFCAPGEGGERAIEGGPLPRAGASLIGAASARVPRSLVGAEEEDGAVFVEDVLGAVAVVDVPIDDEDAIEAVTALGVAGGDGDVIKDAKAHAVAGIGVVTGWPDEAEGSVDGPGRDGIHGGESAADGGEGGGPGGAGDGGVASAERVMAGEDFALGEGGVGGGVREGEIGGGDFARGEGEHLWAKPGGVEGGGDGIEAMRRFRVAVAGIVGAAGGVCEEGGSHAWMKAKNGCGVEEILRRKVARGRGAGGCACGRGAI